MEKITNIAKEEFEEKILESKDKLKGIIDDSKAIFCVAHNDKGLKTIVLGEFSVETIFETLNVVAKVAGTMLANDKSVNESPFDTSDIEDLLNTLKEGATQH